MSFELPLRVPRLGRLEAVFLIVLALGAGVWTLEWFGRAVPGGDLIRLAAYIAALALAFKLLRAGVHKLLWRVRNRMIVVFLFIGVVPLVLVGALVGLAGYFLIGQAAVYMTTSELDRRAVRLQETAATLLWRLRTADAASHPALINSYLQHVSENWPGLRGWIVDGGNTIVYPPGAALEPPAGNPRGFVRLQGGLYLAEGVPGKSGADPTAPETADGTEPETPLAGNRVILLQPLSEAYLAGLAAGLGDVRFWLLRRDDSGRPMPRRGDPQATGELRASVPPPSHRFDYEVVWGTSPFPVVRWVKQDPPAHVILLIHTRSSAVYRLLFGKRVEVASYVTAALIVIATMFLIVELASLVIGVSLTRTLTSSVHQLYEGTQRVNRGDFSHRIEIGSRDQLAELSRSFNAMTESIERLIEESKERQRMASELAIAREVQEQLFPKASPEMRQLEILGVCNAARMVSGDYFDWVKISDDRLALAIGDVAGKGIQGALLMASIQSMLRTQLSAAVAKAESDGAAWRFPTADLVSKLNLQLYHNTAPEKYATFFFGAYDDRHGLLTYTNAGHLPPVLIRNEQVRRLDVNGMVVGAFPFARYEQSEIQLEPGDLMVAFTDGVTEPENEFAEEFGEDRLIELLVRNRQRTPREIIDEVIGAVGRWTGRPELQDDMTLLVARRI